MVSAITGSGVRHGRIAHDAEKWSRANFFEQRATEYLKAMTC
jgi:hypothetical protein